VLVRRACLGTFSIRTTSTRHRDAEDEVQCDFEWLITASEKLAYFTGTGARLPLEALPRRTPGAGSVAADDTFPDRLPIGVDGNAELFKYPLAYMTEPGFWTMSDTEAAGLRAYLLKGGFIIFDDFRADGLSNSGGGWANFEGNIQRAFPELRLMEIDAAAQIFHSFFNIESFDIVPQSYDRGRFLSFQRRGAPRTTRDTRSVEPQRAMSPARGNSGHPR
jgi:uncharacterized protein DUF4159